MLIFWLALSRVANLLDFVIFSLQLVTKLCSSLLINSFSLMHVSLFTIVLFLLSITAYVKFRLSTSSASLTFIFTVFSQTIADLPSFPFLIFAFSLQLTSSITLELSWVLLPLLILASFFSIATVSLIYGLDLFIYQFCSILFVSHSMQPLLILTTFYFFSPLAPWILKNHHKGATD